MGIERTYTVNRKVAIEFLTTQNVEVFANDSNERLEILLYENRLNDTENYEVTNYTKDNAPSDYKNDFWKDYFY